MDRIMRVILVALLFASPATAADYYTASGDPTTGSALSSSILRTEYSAIATGFTKIAGYTGNGTRIIFINAGGTAQSTDSAFTYNATTDVLTVNTSTFGLNTSILGTLGVTGVATLTAQPILSSLTASQAVFTDGSKGLVSNAISGTGNVAMTTSPVFTTPNIGVATATSVNKITITAPATGATLTLVEGSTLATSGAYSTTLTATGATNVILPTTGTLATLAGTEELDSKTLDSSVGKGTWTASGTWTLPAITLGGTVSGGGNQINNVVIGAVTPLAISGTTLTLADTTGTPIILSTTSATWSGLLDTTATAGATNRAELFFRAKNASAAMTTFGGLRFTSSTLTAGAEVGTFDINLRNGAGALVSVFQVIGGGAVTLTGTLSATGTTTAPTFDRASAAALTIGGTATSLVIGAATVTPASSGTRYLCISTAGVVTSSASACSGT